MRPRASQSQPSPYGRYGTAKRLAARPAGQMDCRLSRRRSAYLTQPLHIVQGTGDRRMGGGLLRPAARPIHCVHARQEARCSFSCFLPTHQSGLASPYLPCQPPPVLSLSLSLSACPRGLLSLTESQRVLLPFEQPSPPMRCPPALPTSTMRPPDTAGWLENISMTLAAIRPNSMTLTRSPPIGLHHPTPTPNHRSQEGAPPDPPENVDRQQTTPLDLPEGKGTYDWYGYLKRRRRVDELVDTPSHRGKSHAFFRRGLPLSRCSCSCSYFSLVQVSTAACQMQLPCKPSPRQQSTTSQFHLPCAMHVVGASAFCSADHDCSADQYCRFTGNRLCCCLPIIIAATLCMSM
ncbi:hypothetical protein F4780DRAFT_620997 [Xylariomycetidae sp. FL0641]|nr:hypothetical protein F4780DRAFT_620997 [Xylariomycetidae sp. FL0641]